MPRTDCGDPGCTECHPDEDEIIMRPTDKTNLPPTRRACGNCGRLGHISTERSPCDAPKKAHAKIGIEVEGWWMLDHWDAVKAVADNWHMSGSEDGSLDHDDDDECKAYEFRTRPGSLGESVNQVIAVYPDKCHRSAGMHIHMSFADPMDISLLCSERFFAYFRTRWQAWGERMQVHKSSEFWPRLRGENSYCKVNDPPVRGRRITSGDRYRQLNFTSFERHGTMECRLLPLFRDCRLAVSAIEEWVAIVEDFLANEANAMLATYERTADVPSDVVGIYNVERDLESIANPDEYPTTYEHEVNSTLYAFEIPEAEYHSWSTQWTYTRELDVAPQVIERSPSVDIPESTPVTPGHVRLFGRQARALQDYIQVRYPAAVR